MSRYRSVYVAIAAFVLLGGLVGLTGAAAAIPASVTAAVNHYARPPIDRMRDPARKPADAIAFAMIKPGDKAVDLVPDDGYYTRMLSKLVGNNGRVYSYVPIPGYPPDERAKEDAMIKAGKKPPRHPVDVALSIQDMRTQYNNITVAWEQIFAFGGSFGLPEQVDAVFVANNYHNLHVPGFAYPADEATDRQNYSTKMDLVAANKGIFRAMKPGGVYTVIDAAAAKGAGFTQAEKLHRADPDAVKAEILAAGFVLDGESALLANPADDHTKAADERSDRFMLRFKKPASATGGDKRPPDSAVASYFGNTTHSGSDPNGGRWVHYHPDKTFEEYGALNLSNPNAGSPVQQGTWFWNVDGHNCMLKEYPPDQRGSVICHDMLNALNRKVGDSFLRGVAQGGPYKVEPGYTYPQIPPLP